MTARRLCDIFKSLKHQEMYLYVDRDEGLERVPEELLDQVGKTARVTTLVLTPDRKLARARAAEVLAAIDDKGYYLQLPPAKEQRMEMEVRMRDLAARNEKLQR